MSGNHYSKGVDKDTSILYVCQPVLISTPLQNSSLHRQAGMKLKPGHLELFVRNPMQARDFYTNALGFKVQEIQLEEYVWLQLDGLMILLRPGTPPPAPQTYQRSASGIVLYTDNLENSRSELQERGVEFKGTDGSDRCLTFTDPDGNWFQLVDPNHH